MVNSSKDLKKDCETISTMFDGIASKYDSLNHILSLDIDKLWRKKLVKFIKNKTLNENNPNILDIACGTGDSSIALSKEKFKVTGIDISKKMLEIALKKNVKLQNPPTYVYGSAENLPFNNSIFDAVTISFGIRNFDNRDKCIKEIFRVVKDNGTIGILEFAKPSNCILKFLYNLYFNNVLPFVGGIISKDKQAYKYFAKSVEDFPKFSKFCTELEEGGFKNVSYKKLSFGICVLYSGTK